MKVIINVNELNKRLVYLLINNYEVNSTDDLNKLLAIIKYKALSFINIVLRQKTILWRAVFDLDDKDNCLNQLKLYADKEQDTNPVDAIPIYNFIIVLQECTILHPLHLKELLLSASNYFRIQNKTIKFKNCTCFDLVVDTANYIEFENTVSQGMVVNSTNYNIKVLGDSKVGFYTDFLLKDDLCKGSKSNKICVFVPSHRFSDIDELAKRICLKLAKKSVGLNVSKSTKVYMILNRRNAIPANKSSLFIEGNANVQYYCSPLKVALQLPVKASSYNNKPFDTFEFPDKGCQCHLYHFPVDYIYANIPNVSSYYEEVIDISRLLRETIKELDEPYL